nr:hypothetical protein CFP56_78645 [Quercus suber]
MSILRARSQIHHLRRTLGVRVISTVTGDSGRVYTNGTLIRQHPQHKEMDIYKAESPMTFRRPTGYVYIRTPMKRSQSWCTPISEIHF